MNRTQTNKYWTRARVIDGLRRFYRTFKEAPRSSDVIAAKTAGLMTGTRRSFPPKGAIFAHFESMYEAWKATGIEAALPHCECGAILAAYHKRCCSDCKPKRMSAGITRGWAGKRKYIHTAATDAEITRVYTEQRRNSKVPRIKNLAKKLGFPRHVVTQRASRLGLTPNNKAPNYKPEELDLIEKYAYLAPSPIQRKLKEAGFVRTTTGINLVLKRLELRRDTPFFTGLQLAKALGEDGHVVTRWAQAKLIPYSRKGRQRNGSQHGDIRLFHEVDVYIFLISNRHLYDLRKVNKDWLLEMLIDFPRAHSAEIEARKAEVSTAEPPQWSGSKWRERKPTMYKRRPPERAEAA